MSLGDTRALIDRAVRDGTAVGAFNVITLEHAEGIVAGLERAGVGGLLQVSENAVRFHGGMAALVAACRELADAAAVEVALHLDHLQDSGLARATIAAAPSSGVTSLMVDAAHLPYEANAATTADLAAAAHGAGLWVEAELGEIGGKSGAHVEGVRTDPEEARAFTARTGVDGLAVAVGSVHAMTSVDARLDVALIRHLAERVPVPLVLHGASGVSRAGLQDAVRAGVRKVNVGTALNVAYTGELRRRLGDDPSLTDPRRYLADARAAVAGFVAELCGALQLR